MAITETPTTSDAPTAVGAEAPVGYVEPTGLGAVLGSGDHKTIGRLYVAFASVFGVAAFAMVGLSDLQGIGDGGTVLGLSSAFPVFTLGQLSLVLLVAIPLFLGLATAIVPLQVGANTVAFPRAAALAFWTWLVSAGALICAYAIDGAIGSGGNSDSQQLALVALIGLSGSLVVGSVCVVTTVVALRTDGMALDRVPFFSWSMLVAGGLWAMTLGVFAGNVLLVLIAVKYGTASKYAVAFNQWPQLAWLVAPPALFTLAIPALGVIGDAVSTFSGSRQPRRGLVLFAIGAFGALSFGAYVQPFFNDGAWHQWIVVGQSALLVLPLLMLLGAFGAAMKAGKPKLASPAILGLVALLLLLLATLLTVPFGIQSLELTAPAEPLIATNQALREAATATPPYLWGLLALVASALVIAAAAGIYLWAPKLAGRRLGDGLGKLLVLVLGGGALLASVPLLVVGFAAKANGIADAADALFGAAGAGAVLLALGIIATIAPLLAARASVLGGGRTDDADAWGTGQTLEWLCDSPPATGNFGTLAVVTSPEPLLDLTEGGED
jgi:heme/copper-type cytochrome/quinol oxidase subunit 1